MLIRFSCKNFKSIGMEPLTLEMVSSTRIKQLPGHVCASSNGAKVLRNAVIYGGNAAGKTSIIRALSFMKAAVLSGAIPQEGIREFCKCGMGHEGEETTFDVQFQINGNTYDYGFSCILTKLMVTSEWLYKLGATEAEEVFTRNGAKGLSYEKLAQTLSKTDKNRLSVYSSDFSDRNRKTTGAGLFLQYMAMEKSYDAKSPLNSFSEAFQWFNEKFDIIVPGAPASSIEYYSDGKTLAQVSDVLASFDTGISSLKKQAIPMDELEKYVPVEVAVTLRDILQKNAPKNEEARFALTVRNDDFFLGIERKGLNEPQATMLKTSHENSLLDFDFRDESDGTRRLFDFMDLLFTRSSDKLFVVDELNRSFHPMLTRQLVKLFNEVHAHDDCQLVFTTHENDIMSYEFFRRDEIWFVDRSIEGVSVLYPLDDFAANGARSDARLSKQYLEGRYGGVPVLSEAKALKALGISEV